MENAPDIKKKIAILQNEANYSYEKIFEKYGNVLTSDGSYKTLLNLMEDRLTVAHGLTQANLISDHEGLTKKGKGLQLALTALTIAIHAINGIGKRINLLCDTSTFESKVLSCSFKGLRETIDFEQRLLVQAFNELSKIGQVLDQFGIGYTPHSIVQAREGYKKLQLYMPELPDFKGKSDGEFVLGVQEYLKVCATNIVDLLKEIPTMVLNNNRGPSGSPSR